MKLMTIVSLILLSQATLAAQLPLVFMRENDSGKQIILSENGKESVLSTGARWHLYPDISPDGQWVTWVEGPSDKDLSVVLYNRGTRARERWTTPVRGMGLQPRFSKNGKQIFFSAPTKTGNRIAVINLAANRTDVIGREADGTRLYTFEPTMVPHDGQGYFPRPASDGSFVVFQRNTLNGKEIVEYDFMSQQIRVLAQGMAPALSADENWVAYTSKEGGSWDIWLVNRRTGGKTQLTNDPKDEMAPTFLPDNSVVFASNRTEHFQLYQMEKGDWTQVVTSDADDYAPNFAGEPALKQSLLAPMLPPLRSSFGAIEHDGKIYVCGGHAGSEHTYPLESFVDNMQVYNPATAAWRELAPRPHKAHGFQLASYGRYIYAFGGFAFDPNNNPKWKSIDSIDRFDTVTETWATVGQLPRARSSNVVATVGSKAYLIGGWDSTPKTPGDLEGTFHSAVDVFDMATEKVRVADWTLPAPLRRAFTAVVHNDNIILVGGLGVGSSHFELIASVTEINPVTGFMNEISTLPFATFAPAAGMLGEELMVFGGMFKTGEQDYEYVSHAYAMSMANLTWRHTGHFLQETKGFSQVVPFQGGLAVLGGHHYYVDRDSPVNTVEFFSK